MRRDLIGLLDPRQRRRLSWLKRLFGGFADRMRGREGYDPGRSMKNEMFQQNL